MFTYYYTWSVFSSTPHYYLCFHVSECQSFAKLKGHVRWCIDTYTEKILIKYELHAHSNNQH